MANLFTQQLNREFAHVNFFGLVLFFGGNTTAIQNLLINNTLYLESTQMKDGEQTKVGDAAHMIARQIQNDQTG